ncbi:hypothetical protein [uncultured Oceanisphaera sp.]|uniref:hypothetical protein n=1 Tax=uncultured Oceanisphaera sp. TaxID=353858 RepID=UPI00263A2159|nr:hypothetical protein [uncultured Oceanisphaera sp.]
MNAPVKLDKCLNIQQVLGLLDNIKLKHFSLPAHTIAELADHERELYFSLLALLLLAGGNISANQHRLLQLLLPAIGLTGKLPALMARAQKISQEDLETGIELLKEKELAKTFIVDALVLCRLEQPLNQDQCRILAELVALLGLHQADMEHLAQVAALILGLPQTEELPSDFNPDPLKLDCWEEFLYRELTAEHLQAGIHNGYWRVSAPLNIDFPFVVNNTEVYFSENGRLNIKTTNEIKINNTTFTNPVIKVNGTENLNFSLYNCTLKGEYSTSKKTTALTLNKVASKFEHTDFETKNSRALRIIDGSIEINECNFNNCGHPDLVGGGVSSRTNYFYINKTKFSKCKAKIAGGVRASHAKIKDCHFKSCRSLYINECDFDLEDIEKSVSYGHNAGGLFLDYIAGEHDIEQCSFEKSSIKIKSKRNYDLMRDCKMLDSTLAVNDSGTHIYGQRHASKITNSVYLYVFSGSSRGVPHQTWWDDF